ncbi:Syntaxin-related protein KNOLLE [Platanthera zijinensis]|uniref:Syntaxin-related protein KNOLLE n=1 Tax=Platanthera zijinensis TaxID=2320716 RepID=A0AAP0G4L2_9ASPA
MMTDYRHEVERRYFVKIGEVPSEEVVEKMISERKSDVAKVVERSLLELHQVFLDMAIIVEAQVDKMDDIEHHVISAAHYIKAWIQGTEFSKDIPMERPEMVSHRHHSPPCANHASCNLCCNQPKKVMIFDVYICCRILCFPLLFFSLLVVVLCVRN